MDAVLAEHWAKGGEGAANLAEKVIELLRSEKDDLSFCIKMKILQKKKYK